MAGEGFREAVDDVRYLTLLLEMLDEAEMDPENRESAHEVRKWLEESNLDRDLDQVRAELVDRILAPKRI